MKNWNRKKLSDLSKKKDAVVSGPFGSNLKVSDYKEEGVPILRLQNIGKGFFIEKEIKFINESKAEELKHHSFISGDIALAKLGIPIGKTCIIPDSLKSGIITADIVRIRPDKNIVSYSFLEYFLNTDDSVSQLTGNISGATRPRVNLSDVRNIEVPLPTLSEQKHIVAILNEAFATIGKLKAIAEQNLKNAKELFESYLQSVFTNNSENWEGKKLGDVCEVSSKLIDPRDSNYQNLLHIGGGNIESRTGNLIDLKTAKEEKLISGKFLFNDSMVLYSKIRPYLMKVVKCEFEGLCSADIYPLVTFNNLMIRDFLYYLLLTQRFTEYAIQGSQRAGMPKVNRDHLFEYRFHIPPLLVQQTIVRKLDALKAETKKLEVIYQHKLNDLEELKKSLLQKAFNGELKTADTAVLI
jgi:type I restriction enzyme S subunit